jgi:hypothetical protein
LILSWFPPALIWLSFDKRLEATGFIEYGEIWPTAANGSAPTAFNKQSEWMNTRS